jgi:hypothetical protein
MAEQEKNLYWHDGAVTRQQRHQLLGQKGFSFCDFSLVLTVAALLLKVQRSGSQDCLVVEKVL